MSIAARQRLLSAQTCRCHTAMVFVKRRVILSLRKTVDSSTFGDAYIKTVGNTASEPPGMAFTNWIPINLVGLHCMLAQQGRICYNSLDTPAHAV